MTDSSYALNDPANTPADVFRRKDPASFWPGAPPNFSQDVVPHIFTVSGTVGLAGKAYLNADEAMRHNPANAARMRVDCGIMECLEARQRATALLDWHIEPEDAKDANQKDLAERMTQILKRTPRFTELQHTLMQATWYGRYGAAMQYATKTIHGRRCIAVRKWQPRNGDKLVFRYDDGTGQYDSDQVGIRVGTMGQFSRGRLNPQQIQYTEHGMVYWFSEYERKLIAIHKHTVEDGDFDDPYSSGHIHGVGIRSRVYWTWYAMVECLQRALEYLDRSAFGVELWRYPANNAAAKASTEKAALNHVGGGRSIVFVPTWSGDQADMYGVEHIEPGLQGVDKILQVIKEYFGHKIKRYILGQTLTSEADSTGLGSGVADAHLATFADIVAYDARNEEETITEDILRPLQLWNHPDSADVYLKFCIDNESPNADAKLKAMKSAWDMGCELDPVDVLNAVGVSAPAPGAPRVFNPQIWSGIQQSTGVGGGAPPSSPSTPEQLAGLIRHVVGSAGQPMVVPPVAMHHPDDLDQLQLND